MPDTIKAWQCIGCGRVEAPEPCVGVCRDRQIELIDAAEYSRLEDRLRELERPARRLEGVVGQMAPSTPLNEAWELSFTALKNRARAALATPAPAIEKRLLAAQHRQAAASRSS